VLPPPAAAAGAAARAERPRLAALTRAARATPARARLNWALLGVVAAAVLVKAALAASPAENERAVRAAMPVDAVRYLQANAPAGPLFNAYNWGGYLVWTLYPTYPVFIDGRTDLYDDPLLREYLDVALARPGFAERLDARGINLVLVEAGSPLDEELRAGDGWRRLHADDVAVIYQRRGAGGTAP
jgi:hypothetical protein